MNFQSTQTAVFIITIPNLVFIITIIMELVNGDNIPDYDRFLQACYDDDHTFVREAVARRRLIVWSRDQDYQNGMHIACESENKETAKELVKAEPRLCADKDRRRRTPLHIAVTKGNLEIIGMILGSCPESVTEETSFDETVLHLAAKHDQIDAFKVLLDDILKRNLNNLFDKKDCDGSDVLQLAVQRKHVQIVEWLVKENPKRCPLVRMDSKNGQGLTALELHSRTDSHENDRAISQLLQGATTEARGVPDNQNRHKEEEEEDTCCSRFTVLEVICGIILSATYTSVFKFDANLNYKNIEVLSAREVLLHPDRLPPDFYNMTFMTVAFTACVIGLVVSAGSTAKRRSYRLRVLSSFILIALFLSYAFTVATRVPKFLVAINESTVSSFWLVWAYAVPLVLLICAVYFALECCCKGK